MGQSTTRPGVQNLTLLQRGAERAVQAVLEVHVALPLHNVARTGRRRRSILVEQRVQVQGGPSSSTSSSQPAPAVVAARPSPWGAPIGPGTAGLPRRA